MECLPGILPLPRESSWLLMTGISPAHRYMIQQLSLAADWMTDMGAGSRVLPPDLRPLTGDITCHCVPWRQRQTRCRESAACPRHPPLIDPGTPTVTEQCPISCAHTRNRRRYRCRGVV